MTHGLYYSMLTTCTYI